MNEYKNGRYVDDYNCIAWYKHGELHREDGPAIEASNGTKKWYFEGKLHRFNQPAIEYYNNHQEWFEHGKRHRLDGPAISYGINSRWFIYGIEYTKEEYDQFLHKKKLNDSLNQNLNPKKIISKMKI